MKKIIVLSAAVLVGTFAFASRTSATKATGSTVSVMSTGSELVKVFYKSLESGKVTVSIFNAKGEVVFTDKIRHSEGFTRPYNFKNLPEGEYTIEVKDDNGKQYEKISYGHRVSKSIKKDILITKVPNEEGKFMVTGFTSAADKINVRIYDRNDAMIFEKTYDANGAFGDLYNLKELKGSFTIEVSDAEGSLKEYKS